MPPTQTQNRKDLLQAYRLMTTRSALALIAGEPDSPNQPLRRRSTATVSGILVAVIVCVLFGVLGAMGIVGSAETNLAQKGSLVIDQDTGTPYVPCDNGDLCPALNYTSALLALRNGHPAKTTVSQAQLAGTKIGPTIGIMGLPQDLPTESNLVKGPWAVCDNGSDVSTLVGGTSVHGTPLGGSTAALVRSGSTDYVLWDGQKMEIQKRYEPLIFLGASPRPVTAAWLNAVPSGPPFAPPPVPGLGGNSSVAALVPNKVGQVFNTSTGPAVLEQDGLHPVTPLQSLLLQEEEPNMHPAQPPTVGAANNNLRGPVPNPFPSPRRPQPGSVSGTVCYTYSTTGKQAITTGAAVPANATSTGNSGPTTVNQVWLPAGGGALIGMTSQPGSKSASSWALLSGATRYGLNGSGVASMLGYNLSKDQTYLPASVVGVLPEGKGLDPVAAAQPASG